MACIPNENDPRHRSKKSIHNVKEITATANLPGKLVTSFWNVGGAYRDRTDDLKLAKLALSQLSYGPVVVEIVVGSGGPGKT